MKRTAKVYIFSVLLPLAVGGLSALLSGGNMKGFFDEITKPALLPPAWLFPVAWTILYTLMGIGAARVYLSASCTERGSAIRLYFISLAVNFFWSIIFFNMRAYLFAFIWLLLLLAVIILMTFRFSKCDLTAAYLQIPYILWVTFAGYLTLAVWILNR